MSSNAALRRQARDGATRRGHELGYFTTEIKAAGSLSPGWKATCKVCGASAQVIPGYSYEVFGDAVAVDCPGAPVSALLYIRSVDPDTATRFRTLAAHRGLTYAELLRELTVAAFEADTTIVMKP